ncbi:hypothetical protein SAMN05216302_100986 [Nitrosomonas aestuarii]|uniref:Uncharacterized protein n=1 Tax=Nitrosomonas aestuarii TaxID=52441 RepID=A0A1I4AKR8_9PROT|nr:hypothetical protein [Nitrosomonas aestuarii]SFK57102.1 hypothetical protein SAMN05216302_100986 [Nitrosomonas aestuarii]
MTRELGQQNKDEEVLAELDRFVIEAIDTLIATSKQVKTVRQRQQTERHNLKSKAAANKVTRLKPRFHSEDDLDRLSESQSVAGCESTVFNESDETLEINDMAGMTPRQRERADVFAGWLIQQDNYPVILLHIEELLTSMEEDFSWNDYGNEKVSEVRTAEQSDNSKSEAEKNEDVSDYQ